MPTFKIIGGHGHVALLLAKELSKNPANKVVSLFRSANQTNEIAATGATPQLFDLESADVSDFKTALSGADYIIWSAGAGGKGGSERTYAIDRDAAIRSIQACEQLAELRRYIVVSYLGVGDAPQQSKDNPLYHYGLAKYAADEYLKKSQLKYTIVEPGRLNFDELSGKIAVAKDAWAVAKEGGSISRANVAKVIATILLDKTAFNNTLGKEVEIMDGETAIDVALRNYP